MDPPSMLEAWSSSTGLGLFGDPRPRVIRVPCPLVQGRTNSKLQMPSTQVLAALVSTKMANDGEVCCGVADTAQGSKSKYCKITANMKIVIKTERALDYALKCH